jgi:hypothetical protein
MAFEGKTVASSNAAYTIKTAGEAWSIAHASATDAANRDMRKAGRARWSRADSDNHTALLYRSLENFGFWRDDRPTSLYFAMMADRSAPFVIPA